jgi:hypothetical protein
VGVLFRSVQAEWNTLVQRAEAGERMVPRFCRREVEGSCTAGCSATVLRAASRAAWWREVRQGR